MLRIKLIIQETLYLEEKHKISFSLFFLLNSVNPHLPQVSLSLCAAMNTPFPHLGQSLLRRSTETPSNL